MWFVVCSHKYLKKKIPYRVPCTSPSFVAACELVITIETEELGMKDMLSLRTQKVRRFRARMQREVRRMREAWKMCTGYLAALKPTKIPGRSDTRTLMETRLLFNKTRKLVLREESH